MPGDPPRRDRLEVGLEVTALLMLAMAVLWHGLAPIAGYDIWWQMATGREILASGSFLPEDPFSHSRAGADWPYKDVGACLAFHGLDALGGPAALVVFKALVYLATVAMLLDMMRRRKIPFALAMAFASLAVASVAFRFNERPQIFSFLIAAAFIWVIDRHLRGKGAPDEHGSLYWTIPLILLNANLHRAGLLLPVLLAGYVAAVWLQRRRALPTPKHAMRDALICLGVGSLACLINPSGTAIVSTSVAMIEDPLLHSAIPEWWPASPANLWAATPATVLVLVVVGGGLACRGRRQDPWDLILIVLAVATGFRGVRFLPYIALLAIVPAAAGWATRPAAWTGSKRHLISLGATAAVLAATLSSPLPGPRLGLEQGRYPSVALDFVRRSQPTGALYNDFGPGGYLIYHLGGQRPDDRVYIDGRNDILYEPQFIAEYLRSRGDATTFESVVEQHDIQWLFLECNVDDRRRAFVDRSERWVLVHVSEQGLIYVREDGPNAELAKRHGYDALHPHELSASLSAAASNPRLATALEGDIERWLAEDPDGIKAHMAAAKLHVVLGPTHKLDLDRELNWLRARGMEI